MQSTPAQGTVWLSSKNLDFGNKVTTETSANVVSLFLSNPGPGTLEFTGAGLAIEGPDAEDFFLTDIVTTAPRANQGASSRELPIAFAPKSLGPKSATLVVTTTDPTAPTTTVSLSGTGVPFRSSLVTGRYNGYGPGRSTVGTGGDYPSLFEAAKDLRHYPLTGGDWTFLILNDLNEAHNVQIAQQSTNGHTITIRPAPDTSPTVTFTSTTNTIAGSLVSSHIGVGTIFEDRFPSFGVREHPEDTSRIVIDGCNVPGGSSRDLTIQNLESPNGSLPLIVCEGNTDQIQILNCRLYSYPQTGNRGIKSIVSFQGRRVHHEIAGEIASAIADHCTVSNCELKTTGVTVFPVAYNSGQFNATLNKMGRELVITSNTIYTRQFGIEVSYASDSQITSNLIIVDPSPNRFTGDNYGLAAISFETFKAVEPWSSNVSGNRIEFRPSEPSGLGLIGIRFFYSNMADLTISNNMISGLVNPPVGFSHAVRYGILAAPNADSTVTLAHNSINLHEIENGAATSATRSAAIHIASTNSSMTTIMRNNILRTSLPNSAALYITGQNGIVDSDHNNLFATNGAITALAAPLLPTGTTNQYLDELADWQTWSGQDMNSISKNPFVAAGGGLGKWMGPEDDLAPDLHFTSYPGSEYRVPPYPGVIVDIDGEPRHPVEVIMGADETPLNPAAVNGWNLY